VRRAPTTCDMEIAPTGIATPRRAPHHDAAHATPLTNEPKPLFPRIRCSAPKHHPRPTQSHTGTSPARHSPTSPPHKATIPPHNTAIPSHKPTIPPHKATIPPHKPTIPP